MPKRILLLLLVLSLGSCTPKPESEPLTGEVNGLTDAQRAGNEDLGLPLPTPDQPPPAVASLVSAQLVNPMQRLALVVGLPGAVDTAAGVNRVCAANLRNDPAALNPDCAPPSDVGTFHLSLASSDEGDEVAVWTEGPADIFPVAGGFGVNDIRKTVVLFLVDDPTDITSFAPFDSGRRVAVATLYSGVYLGDVGKLLTTEPAEFEHLTMREGVPANHVMDVLDDRHGGFWLATGGGGLGHATFDAAGKPLLKTYTSNDRRPTHLPYDHLHWLAPGEADDIWIGLGATAMVHVTLDPLGEPVFKTYCPSDCWTAGRRLTALITDRQGGLWVGTKQGVGHFTVDAQGNSTLPVYPLAEAGDLKGNEVTSLLLDRSGALWITTLKGLARMTFREGVPLIRNFSSADGLPGNLPATLHEDPFGRIWIGHYGLTGEGLSRVEESGPGSWTITTFSTVHDVRLLRGDGNGGAWMVERSGMSHLATGPDGIPELRPFRRREGIPTGQLRALEGDGGNGIWVGTHGAGVTHVTLDGNLNPSYRTVRWENGLAGTFVADLLLEGNGALWVATSSGLSRITRDGTGTERIRNFYQAGGLPGNEIRSLAFDSEGTLWVGTTTGLGRLSPTDSDSPRIDSFGIEAGLPSARIRKLAPGGEKSLWVGTWNGLAHLTVGEAGILRCETALAGLEPPTLISALLPDGSGGVFFATSWDDERFGRATLDAEGKISIEIFPEFNLFTTAMVGVMTHDGRGGLRLGTSGGGLLHVTFNGAGRPEFAWSPFNRDLPSLMTTDILSLSNGGLWLSMEGGIALLPPQ